MSRPLTARARGAARQGDTCWHWHMTQRHVKKINEKPAGGGITCVLRCVGGADSCNRGSEYSDRCFVALVAARGALGGGWQVCDGCRLGQRRGRGGILKALSFCGCRSGVCRERMGERKMRRGAMWVSSETRLYLKATAIQICHAATSRPSCRQISHPARRHQIDSCPYHLETTTQLQLHGCRAASASRSSVQRLGLPSLSTALGSLELLCHRPNHRHQQQHWRDVRSRQRRLCLDANLCGRT